MKYGARNKIVGTVESIKKGTIMSQVKVRIPAESTMECVMTVDSLDDLDIKDGDQVRLVVKAIHVLLVRE